MANPLLAQIEAQVGREAPHLSEADAWILCCLVERLVAVYQPERLYLFGSKARGDFGPESDFDLMIIVPDNASSDRQQSRLAYEHMWEIGMGADVLVWTRSRFEQRAIVRASLQATILREGKLLYAA